MLLLQSYLQSTDADFDMQRQLYTCCMHWSSARGSNVSTSCPDFDYTPRNTFRLRATRMPVCHGINHLNCTYILFGMRYSIGYQCFGNDENSGTEEIGFVTPTPDPFEINPSFALLSRRGRAEWNIKLPFRISHNRQLALGKPWGVVLVPCINILAPGDAAVILN